MKKKTLVPMGLLLFSVLTAAFPIATAAALIDQTTNASPSAPTPFYPGSNATHLSPVKHLTKLTLRVVNPDCVCTYGQVSFVLSDSSDSYLRYWAVFGDGGASNYQGNGVWSGYQMYESTFYSGSNMTYTYTATNNIDASPAVYICVSVPSTGYGSYSGSYAFWQGSTEKSTSSPSGITETSCASVASL